MLQNDKKSFYFRQPPSAYRRFDIFFQTTSTERYLPGFYSTEQAVVRI